MIEDEHVIYEVYTGNLQLDIDGVTKIFEQVKGYEVEGCQQHAGEDRRFTVILKKNG